MIVTIQCALFCIIFLFQPHSIDMFKKISTPYILTGSVIQPLWLSNQPFLIRQISLEVNQSWPVHDLLTSDPTCDYVIDPCPSDLDPATSWPWPRNLLTPDVPVTMWSIPVPPISIPRPWPLAVTGRSVIVVSTAAIISETSKCKTLRMHLQIAPVISG